MDQELSLIQTMFMMRSSYLRKRRRIDAEVSSLIKKDAVLYTSDPEGDGWCGYRAVAE